MILSARDFGTGLEPLYLELHVRLRNESHLVRQCFTELVYA